MNDYPNLFSPVVIGKCVFRNRILGSPTGHIDIRSDNTFTDTALSYYERKAAGGVAQVCVGECQIDPPTGSRGGACVDLSNPDSVKYLSRLADNISRHGAIASAELQHSGLYSTAALGPSDGNVDGKTCRAMTEDEIMHVINAYARAAAFAKQCGFEMVTIHGGHGWLPQQFFSPFTNQRTDRWGGSAENRGRFAVAVCDAIHAACGRGFPVEFRISATEFEDGYDIDGGIEYAAQLDGHADIIHVSVGVHGNLNDDSWLRFTPSMFMEDGRNVKYAAEIKKHVKQSFVATVGSITDPAMMEGVIAEGKADFIAVARGLLCDPDLPNKARSGRADEIRSCIRCLSCWSNLRKGHILCALNPETGREIDTRFAYPHIRTKTVLVAGGGIAGMQAALTAHENGHHVILCEKGEKLGGGINCEENVPFKRHLREYIELQRRLIQRCAIDLRLGCEVDAELIQKLNPDVLIAAVGTHPLKPLIPGIENENVFSAQEVYINPELAKGKSVIIGAGLVGTELAIYLTMLGHEAELIEQGSQINAEGNRTQGLAINGQLRDRKIKVHFNTRATEVNLDGILCSDPASSDELRTIFCDTVIYAAGQVPQTNEAFELGKYVPEFHMVGDCLGPANIMRAVKTAYTIARDIGRY